MTRRAAPRRALLPRSLGEPLSANIIVTCGRASLCLSTGSFDCPIFAEMGLLRRWISLDVPNERIAVRGVR